MITFEIKLKVKEGKAASVKKQFNERFAPAIGHQSGFYNALLLEQFKDKKDYMMLLFFDTEEQRVDWINSSEHDPAWESIAELCSSFTAKGYDIVDKVR